MRRDGVVVRWIFLRMLGLVFLAAFVSLWTQVDGLFGSKGIAPVAELVTAAKAQLGADGWWKFPTLFWWDASDAALHRACASGSVLSLLLVVGIAPVPVIAGLLALYVSLLTVGSPFLNFQWDTLLIETAFLALFYAPLNLLPRPSREAGPGRASVWLLRYLLFRLMFASGAVKLTSGDVAWANLRAMDFHYMTQPLPPWTAWYWHHLPAFAHTLETLATFVLELGLPFLAFGHRAARGVCFVGFALLLAMLVVTGNFGFFNWLSLALVVTVLDDTLLPARLRRWVAGDQEAQGREWPALVARPVALVCFVVATQHFLLGIELLPARWPEAFTRVARAFEPVHVFNQYGLFRTMTIDRPEVEIEGSRDGVEWKAYEFRYKMGELTRRPPFVAPHMPRLDWQMWFAALGRDGTRQRWFREFLKRVLEGSPAVLGLLGRNPFPEGPPKYIRATLYDYRFSPRDEAQGRWWVRTETGPFFPQASL